MTEARLALAELLEKAGDGDFLRSVAEAVLQNADGGRRRGAGRRCAI
jgi:putative transposase